MNRIVTGLGLLAVVASMGCVRSLKLKRCAPQPRECPPSSCGHNSPVINAFPINGFRPDGECSPEDVQLVPQSMKDGGGCAGATLDFDGNDLIARKGPR